MIGWAVEAARTDGIRGERLVERSVLSNGIRVVSEHIPHVRSVTLGFWFDAGSRDEAPDENGISHFVEHMMFKGTPNRSARDIAEAIDALGGQINAFTTKEHTCFYVRVLDDHLAYASEVLADMLLNSGFPEHELEREKRVVIEEIKMYEDTPDESVHDLFAESVMGPHPLGRGVLGDEASVERFDRDALVAFVAGRYTSDRLVVAAAGNMAHDQVLAEVHSRFERLVPALPAKAQPPPEPLGQFKVVGKETEQVHLVIGGPGPDQHDADRYALFVLDVVLGGGVSSRLFQELREIRGLVYETYSFQSPFRDSGLVGVYAGASAGHVDEVLALTLEQFAQLAGRGVAEAELQRAKEQLKGSLMLSLESTTNRMSRFAKSELAGEAILSPDALCRRIDAVTGDDVRRLAHRLWLESPLSLAAIGPLKPAAARKLQRRLNGFAAAARVVE
ncbi:MAG TPA: pitrilysin family protein [Limnochordia bacterium]|nr:pitrilysin family protein [Limnochordia bacterium]